MGKSKGGARRKGGKGDAAKVAAKASSTLSKRQEKKSQVRKAAARERKGALLSQLETRKAADAAAARGPYWVARWAWTWTTRSPRSRPRRRAGQEPAERGEQPRPARDCGAGNGAVRGPCEGCAVPCRSIGRGAGALAGDAAGASTSGRRKKGVPVCSVPVSSCVLSPPLLAFASVLQGLAWLLSCPQSHQFDAKRCFLITRLIASLPKRTSHRNCTA